jgi:hypothetical protein
VILEKHNLNKGGVMKKILFVVTVCAIGIMYLIGLGILIDLIFKRLNLRQKIIRL